MSNIDERLNQVVAQLCKTKQMTKTAVGENLGYKSGHWFMILSGNRPVTDRLMVSLRAVYGVNPEFLKKGSKPMFLKNSGALADGPALNRGGVRGKIDAILEKMNDDKLRKVLDHLENKEPKGKKTAKKGR